MASLVTDYRNLGRAGQRDTPKGGVSRPVPPQCPGQVSLRVPSLSHVPVCPRTMFANVRVRRNVRFGPRIAGADSRADLDIGGFLDRNPLRLDQPAISAGPDDDLGELQ
jgi:hypothetical protein